MQLFMIFSSILKTKSLTVYFINVSIHTLKVLHHLQDQLLSKMLLSESSEICTTQKSDKDSNCLQVHATHTHTHTHTHTIYINGILPLR